MNATSSFDYTRISARSEYHHTERLALRPLALADAWAVLKACETPQFNENLLWSAPSGPAEMFTRVEDILAEVRRNRMAAASIVLRETGEWVGLVRYFDSLIKTGPANSIEGGLWLHPKFWHAKLGREIGSLMSSAVFLEEQRVAHITARTSKRNRAANALVADIGFQCIGEGLALREDGQEMVTLNHAISREAWLARPLLNHVVHTGSCQQQPQLLAA